MPRKPLKREHGPQPVQRDKCSFGKCPAQAEVIVILNGYTYPLCRKHFTLLNRKLDSLVADKGRASLEDLEIRVSNGRIVKITARADV